MQKEKEEEVGKVVQGGLVGLREVVVLVGADGVVDEREREREGGRGRINSRWAAGARRRGGRLEGVDNRTIGQTIGQYGEEGQ